MPNNKTVSVELNGDVSLDDLANAITQLTKLTETIGGRVAPKARVRWVVSDLVAGSAIVEASGEIIDGGDDDTIDAIIAELESVAAAAESRQPVDPQVQSIFDQMTAMVNGHVTSVLVGGGERYELRATDPGPLPPMAVLDRRTKDLGEVTGRVEGMNVHNARFFTLYDAIDGKSVRVSLPESHAISDYWLKLVTVRGTVTRDALSRPHAVTEIEAIIVHDEPQLGAWREALGVIKSGPGTNAEAIERYRDG